MQPRHGGSSGMMTLRQVEVIRAVMVTGTIGGAAKLLNVSAPGISRLVKYTEKSLGIRFFQRQNGRYPQASEPVFSMPRISRICCRCCVSSRIRATADRWATDWAFVACFFRAL